MKKSQLISKSIPVQQVLYASKKVLLFLTFIITQFCLQGQVSRGAKITNADITPTVRIVPQAINKTRPAFENITLHRIMITIQTMNVEDAGTDDDIYVILRGGEKFFLNYGRDDFERHSTGRYDIITKDVNKIKDIQFLKFGIKGSDAVAVKEISLFLNGHLSYRKTFPNGKWIEQEGKSQSEILIPFATLRSHPNWKYPSVTSTMWMPPAKISGGKIASFIESAVGNQMSKDGSIGWGANGTISDTQFGKHVELKYVNASTIHVDLDLEKTITGPNPEIDVDFDLVFVCNNGSIDIEVKNVKSGTNWWGEIQEFLRGKLKFVICEGIASMVPVGSGTVKERCDGYLGKFLNYSLDFVPAGSVSTAACKTIKVNPDLSISLH